MNPRLATVLSVAFHPLLLPSYLIALILYYFPLGAISISGDARHYLLLLVFLITFVLPTLGTLLLRQAKLVKSLELFDQTDRRWPFLLTATCYTVLTVVFYYQVHLDRIFFAVMGLITSTVYLTLVVNQFWKISAHSVGLGGSLGILLMLHGWLAEPVLIAPIILAIVVCGAVMTARLALKAHTYKQVYAGFALGFLFGISLWGFSI